MAGKRAPSCHLYFDDRKKGDVIVHDVLVPKDGVTKCTYYCSMQWNGGMNGGGYCGIQEHPDGQCFIFSIWDPTTTNEAIEPVYRHPGTKTEEFGGEGTGLKSMNFQIGWKPAQWYTLVSKRWDCKGHTYFGFWVRDQTANIWHHLVTMDFPVSNITFDTPTVSFLEDWHGNGEQYRLVRFKNGYKRTLEGSWYPFRNTRFNVKQEEACNLYNENYNGGVDSQCFFMQTGQGTTPQPVLASDRNFCEPSAAQSSEPTNPPIEFHIQDVTSHRVTWRVSESSTPQFSFIVLVDGAEVGCGVDPERRNCDLDVTQGSKVEVILEDILGRKTSKSTFMRPSSFFFICCQWMY